jgi:hypothetical protein
MRFNPPPNWPLPPGWNPPPGWTPDPSWGPVPAGWQLWVDDSAAATAYVPSIPPQYPVSGGQWAPGPTAYYGPPPSNKTRNILIAVGIGVVVIIAVVLTLVFTLGGPASDEDQIRGAIRGIESAWNNKDFKAWKSHFCQKQANKMDEEDFKNDSDEERVTITVKSITVHGDTADAEVIINTSNSSSTTRTTSTRTTSSSSNDKKNTMKFVKEDGKWLWCRKSG